MNKSILSFLVPFLLMLGCSPQAVFEVGPQAWIDAPLNGMELPLAPYEIVAHAEDPSGISQFEISVDNSVIAAPGGSEGSLSTVRQVWNITAPGEYMVSVRSQGNSGGWGDPAIVKVTVNDAQIQISAEPTGTVPPLPTPTSTALPTPIFVLIKNANCRYGPNQVFNEVGGVFAGDNIPIEGRSEDGLWWLVRLPNGVQCWVAGSTGNATGNANSVPVVQGPPTPIPPPTEEIIQGCFVYDPNQQPVCTVPCPANAQPGEACTP